MTVETKITVVGVRDALRELNKINPALRRQITRDFKEIVKPVIGEAQASLPTDAPLSGMAYSWRTKSGWQIFPYNAGELRRSVVAKINTRRPRPSVIGNEIVGAFRIMFQAPAAQSIDMAGRRGTVKTARGAAMVRGLEAKFGGASRFMWPSYERRQGEVQGEMLRLVERIMQSVNQSVQRV